MRIVICGVGALGSTAVMFLRNVKAELAVVDFDRVESKNLLGQVFVKASVGKNKAEATKLQLASFWGVKVEAFGVRLVPENAETLLGRADLVVDALDNRAGRELVSATCRRLGKPLIHGAVSADGDFGVVRWDERFTADAEDTEGQATCEGGAHLPFLGLVSATLARAVQTFVLQGRKDDFIVTLRGVTQT